jgi:uncharacterized protein YcbK (DUF882 family)
MAGQMKRTLFFLSILMLVGCSPYWTGDNGKYAGQLVRQNGGEKTKPDHVEERSIVLVYPNSGERLNLTYYKNEKYDPKAMRQIDLLLKDRRKNETIKIDPELIDYLVDIRSRLGLPPSAVFEILSGYRAPETNAKLRNKSEKVAKNSFHMRGWAVDFRIKGVSGKAIAEIAKTMQRGGVSYYASSNHVHVDLGNIRTWAAK